MWVFVTRCAKQISYLCSSPQPPSLAQSSLEEVAWVVPLTLDMDLRSEAVLNIVSDHVIVGMVLNLLKLLCPLCTLELCPTHSWQSGNGLAPFPPFLWWSSWILKASGNLATVVFVRSQEASTSGIWGKSKAGNSYYGPFCCTFASSFIRCNNTRSHVKEAENLPWIYPVVGKRDQSSHPWRNLHFLPSPVLDMGMGVWEHISWPLAAGLCHSTHLSWSAATPDPNGRGILGASSTATRGINSVAQ